jgi:membrane protein implicated in regulation of membrane protease activity
MAQAAGRTAAGRANSAAMRRRVREARETASLFSRLLVVIGFALATALCIAGGTSSVVLSPRWLGGVLLAFGAGFAVLTFREARLARALVNTRRLRRRDRQLRGEVRR